MPSYQEPLFRVSFLLKHTSYCNISTSSGRQRRRSSKEDDDNDSLFPWRNPFTKNHHVSSILDDIIELQIM